MLLIQDLRTFLYPFNHLQGLEILNLACLLFHRILPQSIPILLIQFNNLVIVSWEANIVFIPTNLLIFLVNILVYFQPGVSTSPNYLVYAANVILLSSLRVFICYHVFCLYPTDTVPHAAPLNPSHGQ